ncbi:hypothetical protein R1sor_001597 [Riccia sorocarpa]|uniref:Uncharacterized protein n=1 Tax=Riccia sorocarpa TaxID=122646 RepID=A0ABD3GZS8_9MARC
MSGYERNYDFGDLLASGLNRIAWMEFGEENIEVGRSHAKQRTIWGKMHPLQPGEVEPNLSDFRGLQSEYISVVSALLGGLTEAQNLMTQLNMAPHHGVRDQVWWRTPWKMEAELKLFRSTSTRVDEPEDEKGQMVGVTEGEPECNSWNMSLAREVPDPDRRKMMRMTVSTIYLYDCAVLFSTVSNKPSTRAKKGRRATTTVKEVWIGRVQKIRRKYNGRWGKTRSEIDLLDRPVVQAGDGPSCQVLFNWYKPINNSTVKFLYECTDLQWIDLETVITVVTMKIERNVRTVWHLDPNDRARIDEFMSSV